jgi:hypothetical protein
MRCFGDRLRCCTAGKSLSQRVQNIGLGDRIAGEAERILHRFMLPGCLLNFPVIRELKQRSAPSRVSAMRQLFMPLRNTHAPLTNYVDGRPSVA